MDKRIYNYDVLRIIACFLVIVNHTVSFLFEEYSSNVNMFISLIMFFMCKMAIPIFLMLTGALMLSRKQEFDKNYIKRILKILLLLLCVSFGLYFYWHHNFNILVFLKMFLEKEIIIQYWYLYMILGIYILLPFISKMVLNFTNKDFIIFFILGMVFNGIIPFFRIYNIFTLNPQFALPILTYSIWWLVMGYFITHNLKDMIKIKHKYLIGSVLIIAPILIGTILTYIPYLKNNNLAILLDDSMLFTVSIPSLTLFYLINNSNIKYNDISKKVLTSISLSTLGIYILHPFLVDKSFTLYNSLILHMNEILAVIIIQIGIFIVCYGISVILRKIPIIKELF